MRGLAMAAILATSAATAAEATTLDFVASYGLDAALSAGGSNFHPQGLGYDEATGELLFAQQGVGTIHATDLTGAIQSARSTGYSHTTSVAADGTRYFFSDYTANSSGLDVLAMDKAAGSPAGFSSETAAFGGYPIDVRDGTLYRTESSGGYSWGALTQIRISSLATPDVIDRVVTLDTSLGLGDIAIDLDHNAVWALDYAGSASIRRFDLTTGLQLAAFDLGLDGLDAGLTYADGRLYHYDWIGGSGSTLSVYGIAATAVPLPASGLLLAAGLGVAGWVRRRG
ncbi:VPLPA-CTERM sorting domain-containing protein [Albimonas pacifica]|uniref:VPLPA-CTERM protein sorting domain-containing protein n=1 Tax=Albimonas pacifica TaxID=1114924 RepID=A0A1I3C277_9RHOB|nr:VPLPA-CTERM sorting domain-containing protein [Albimonas pacifica]SFH68632.1 VPLPA-CTERM protein sorting domain-containing protein [Albimonas pacifica]